jgi:hypothetical protein
MLLWDTTAEPVADETCLQEMNPFPVTCLSLQNFAITREGGKLIVKFTHPPAPLIDTSNLSCQSIAAYKIWEALREDIPITSQKLKNENYMLNSCEQKSHSSRLLG